MFEDRAVGLSSDVGWQRNNEFVVPLTADAERRGRRDVDTKGDDLLANVSVVDAVLGNKDRRLEVENELLVKFILTCWRRIVWAVRDNEEEDTRCTWGCA